MILCWILSLSYFLCLYGIRIKYINNIQNTLSDKKIHTNLNKFYDFNKHSNHNIIINLKVAIDINVEIT